MLLRDQFFIFSFVQDGNALILGNAFLNWGRDQTPTQSLKALNSRPLISQKRPKHSLSRPNIVHK